MPAPKRPVFRRYDPHQTLLLPPDLNEWLPEEHVARVVAHVVDELLDLEPLISTYQNEEGGSPAFDPRLQLKVLLYGYSVGVTSARRLEKATWDDVATRWLAADQHPHFTTLNRFRLRNLKLIDDLFLQVLKLCQEAGLVRLGRVALDGTKIKANASKHKSRTYEKIEADEEALRRQVRRILREAERVDREEDELYGKDKNPYMHPLPPDWKERLKTLREARKALEDREKKKGKKEPDPKTQYNFTDPDSRIMQESGNKGAYIQGYNAQAAVDAKSQVIVSTLLTQENPDNQHLAPMMWEMERTLGTLPRKVLVDAGYFSEAQIRQLQARGIEVFCPPEPWRVAESAPCRRGRPPLDERFTAMMRRKVRSRRGRREYRWRKISVEPVFGQIKQGRGLRQFLLRGFEKVNAEWKLWGLTHNLRK
ncbi:MAG: IS1182 family transposase, partial [Euryarchaeota archaeon]|nr:IS1182 family transposase [Euryarchaeota archaeon]